MDRFEPHLPRIKQVLHGLQGFCVLIGGILDVVFLVKGDFSGGATTFYLVLCFLTVPALIYNALTLLFPRSRRWGHAYAFALLDILFCILWLSAMASVAAFNSSGLCIGACGVAKAMVGFGFFLFFFFALTSVLSLKNAAYYRAHGSLPAGAGRIPNNAEMIDPHRDAFTAEEADEYAPVGRNSADSDRPYGGANPYNDTSYGGASGFGAGERDSFGGPDYHRRASNDLYSSGAPMEGGRYGLGAAPSGPMAPAPLGLSSGLPAYDDGDKVPDHLGRFESEIARQNGGGMPYEPDSYRVGQGLDTGYGGGRTSTSPAPPTAGGGRVAFPPAPY